MQSIFLFFFVQMYLKSLPEFHRPIKEEYLSQRGKPFEPIDGECDNWRKRIKSVTQVVKDCEEIFANFPDNGVFLLTVTVSYFIEIE